MDLDLDRIEVTYRLPALFKRDAATGLFVSWCPPLGIFSQGTTAKEAKRALNSAVTLYIQTCQKRGILDRQLKLRGAQPVPPGETIGAETDDGDDSRYFIVVTEERDERDEQANRFDVNVAIDLLVARKLGLCSTGGNSQQHAQEHAQ
ncbi:MAG TPA: type II toxin-antitoxin system HicB family antitoxin [Polyangia bacterium]|nr:type II toxin-antitoxin system HicB family antitoxin [Polyangia bacterium]